MTSNSTVISFRQPDEIDDPLTAVLRSGARRLLAQAIEAEAEAFLAAMKDKRLADGRERVVRHGHGPERLVQTGIGPGAFAARNAEVAAQRVKRHPPMQPAPHVPPAALPIPRSHPQTPLHTPMQDPAP